MTENEIQEAAKEAGIEFCPNWGTTYTGNTQIERFAAIIEKRTIERCAVELEDLVQKAKQVSVQEAVAAIRKLGEQ